MTVLSISFPFLTYFLWLKPTACYELPYGVDHIKEMKTPKQSRRNWIHKWAWKKAFTNQKFGCDLMGDPDPVKPLQFYYPQ